MSKTAADAYQAYTDALKSNPVFESGQPQLVIRENESGYVQTNFQNDDREMFYNFEQAVEILERWGVRSEKVSLNRDYEAVVTSEGVTVGCQTFTFEAMDSLADVIARIRPMSRVGQTVPFHDVKIGEKISFGSSIVYTRIPNKLVLSPYSKQYELQTMTYVETNGEVTPAFTAPNETIEVKIVG